MNGIHGRARGIQAALVCGLISALPGCGNRAARALEGRWFGDSVENFDSGDVALATGWARGASMEFSRSTVTVAIPAEDPRKGHFEVESAHEGDLLLAIRDDKGATSRTRLTIRTAIATSNGTSTNGAASSCAASSRDRQ